MRSHPSQMFGSSFSAGALRGLALIASSVLVASVFFQFFAVGARIVM